MFEVPVDIRELERVQAPVFEIEQSPCDALPSQCEQG
jgi:hypothetical protein